ncbi:hypothetical protein IFM53868_10474 [Aspergillus udagawae]|uniref:Arrestin-like N-terminal domain-containing protein n=1 Tax=Aspergillus udagawae TaxID=91492 RepID=A0ABQ1BE96_9EURO|nr:hypothetical protein IFM53868_10474 [Aspergillus udagawae]
MELDSHQLISVDITLRNDHDTNGTFMSSFTTGDIIEGTVCLLASKDVRFDNIEISFIGQETTNLRSSNPSKGYLQFQNFEQQLDESALPDPRILKKNQKYQFPFAFTVVDYLPASSCHHPTVNSVVRTAHLQPPPTFGDATVSGFGGKLRDDFAPSTCRITYAIRVKLNRLAIVSGKQETILSKERKVRIKPAVDEAPPLVNMSTFHQEYTLHHREIIRDPRSKESLGELAVTLEQPKSFRLPLRDPHSLVSQAVRFMLRYTPIDPNTAVPQLKFVRGKLTSTTFYSATFYNDFPTKKKDFLGRPLNFCETKFPPFEYTIPQLEWKQDETGIYSAILLVPVVLSRENFIPTFHSCLMSRIYKLSFEFAVHKAKSFSLRTPIQNSAERDASVLPSYNASVRVIEGPGRQSGYQSL